MDAFKKINSFARVYKFSDITTGEYLLINLKRITTKFGDIIIARLQVDNEEMDFFLPKRFSKLTDKEIDELNKGNYYIEYKGMEGVYVDLDIHFA